MKTIIKITISLVLVQLISTTTFAQAPEKMSYQAVIRDAGDNLLTNTSIGMQISILEGSETGTAVYIETHTPFTNTNGLVSLEIGDGTVISGDFNTIDWTTGSYFIKTESDPEGGINYTISGTSQLLSVPYALYAKSVENTDDADADPANEFQELQIDGNILSLSDDPSSTTIDLASFSGENQTLSVSSETTSAVELALTGSPSISFSIVDADANANNELQTISKSGSTVSLSNGGGSFTDAVNDADANASNELQTISKSGSTVSLSNGGGSFTDAVNDADANATNEIQDISLSGNDLSISDGSTVDLSGISNSGWSTSGNAGTNDASDFIGTTDNQALVFKVNNEIAGRLDKTVSNTAFGYLSNPTISGEKNTSFGHKSLEYNTTGTNNTAIGIEALNRSTTGSQNTATGYRALYGNIIGWGNSAFGNEALRLNNSGIHNSAFGSVSLWRNTTGGDNTALGYFAMYSNKTGSENTAIGSLSLSSNFTGEGNVAIGYSALFNSTAGSGNVAIGYQALQDNTTLSNLVAIGNLALANSTGGISLTAIGAFALEDNTTGDYNVAAGSNCLISNTTGSQNVAIGADALQINTTGNSNVAIGDLAGQTGNYNNRIAIGAATQNTASNQVRIGNSSMTSIGGYANWSNVSDRRFKTDIQENVAGLSFILTLRPVTYKLDLNAIDRAIPNPENDRVININQDKAEMIQTGFIAQEVEEAANSLGYDFSGVDAPKNENDFYGLRYAEFVVPLVKATQEQQALIEAQQQEIDELKKLITQLLNSQ